MSTRVKAPVKIPEALSRQLDAMGQHFLLIKGKTAFETDWNNPQNLMRSDDPKLLAWLRNGGNYGVAGGAGVTIVEADNAEVVERMKQLPAKTYMVKSGGKGLPHYYFKCSAEGNHPLKIWENEPRTEMGYIKAESGYVVGPNCVHPETGNRYEVVCDAEMLQISSKILYTLLDSWIKKKTSTPFKPNPNKQYDIPISSIISLDNLTDCGNGEYRGPHPFHKSTTGWNFRVDLNENTWRCWGCDTGGNGLSLFAIKEGIIKCGEPLRGENFEETLEKAREKGYIEELPFEKEANEEPDKYFTGKKKTFFSPTRVADEILSEQNIITLRDTEEVYIYDPKRGIYQNNGESYIKEYTKKKLKHRCRTRYINEVLTDVKIQTYVDRRSMEPPATLINVENGILDINTEKIELHTPDWFFTIQLPVKYNPSAKDPENEKFRSEIAKDEDIKCLQEFAGYLLLRDYRFQKALLLVGEGSNAKSTWLGTIKALIGAENIASVSLQVLNYRRFAKARLYHKLANIYADLTATALKQTGIFKMTTGGDFVEADVKYRVHPINFVNYAKHMFSANEVPLVEEDQSDAFFRRWIIITFPYKFEGEKADPNILQKLTTPEELSGLLNWALEGLKRLQKQNGFTYKKTTDQIREQYNRLASSVYCFLEDKTEYSPDGWLPKDDLYNAYVDYCIKNNMPRKAKNMFSQELPKHRPAVLPKRRRIDDRGPYVYGWDGITLRTAEGTNLG